MSDNLVPIGTYAAVHNRPNGPGDDRPTARQIVHDESLLGNESRLLGKTVLVTGGTSGLGLEVAKALYTTGAAVYITGRCDVAKGKQITATIEAQQGTDGATRVGFVHMDLSDLESVREGALDFLQQSKGKLNILICNAGLMMPPEIIRTKQGHEAQFGINFLAHMLLFNHLKPALLASSEPQSQSRVIAVSSSAHRSSSILEDDYDFQSTKYDPGASYGQSKTANIYMANELERQFGTQGLHGLSVHPGIIMETGLTKYMTDDPKNIENYMNGIAPDFAARCKNTEQGAASIVWAAVAERLEGRGGIYLEDCEISQPVREGLNEASEWHQPGRSAWCYDKAREKRLWTDAEKLISSYV